MLSGGREGPLEHRHHAPRDRCVLLLWAQRRLDRDGCRRGFSAETDDTVASVAVRTDGEPLGCAATDTTRVHVFDLDGLQASETGAYHPALADRRFVIWFE